MRRNTTTWFAIALAVGLLAISDALAAEYAYVGAESCKICHGAKTGDQWQKWLDGPHSKAFETLKSEASAAIVTEKGLSGNAWELDECLQCHVTAHGVDEAELGKKYAVTEGVGCEACHGPGSEYKSMKAMKSHEAAVAAGLVEQSAEVCTRCHNPESPTFQGFDYEEYVAKIAHPVPAEGK